ncbi:MAG: hypothetical protein WCP29_02195 [Acidobacteriota bacterium]
MRPLARYVLFVALLAVGVGIAVNPELFHVSALSRTAGIARHPAGAVPSIGTAPSQVLAGVHSTGAIDVRADDGLTATGEEGRITLRQLPDEAPRLTIDTDPGFQVLQVRFVPGAKAIAACGQTADGSGGVRVYDTATGKQTQRVDQQEPVIFVDFDRTGRYVVLTALTTVKVWDLVDNQAASVLPRHSADAMGVFFLDDRYVLQGAPVSLYDWKNRKTAAGLDDIGAVDVKKIGRDLYAWLAPNGLHTLRAPYGKREFVPADTQGVASFDLAPDGSWGLFLKRNKSMALVDSATGLTVQTVSFTRQPESVAISQDGATAFVLYGAGPVEVFEVGNENVFRRARFYTTRMVSKLWNDVGELVKRRPWASSPAN